MEPHFATHRPLARGTRWMVTADHPLAARAGAAILESGGNAVDAAVAANLVLTCVRPHMCGPGGDLFALVYTAGKGRLEALNASARAPAQATLDAYRGRGLAQVPEVGMLTCTVPGAIAGWQALLERHGSMGLDRLLADAIDYAENGFPAYDELSRAIEERRAFFSPAATGTFLPGGRVPCPGDVIRQPALALAYRRLADEGPAAFYRGELGRALVAFSRAQGGLFDEQDLRGYAPEWVAPLRTPYRGYEICTHPPNSQGIALLMQADILENFDLSAMTPQGAELVHLMVEAKKLAFADRDRYVCDPDFHAVPVAAMLDREAARRRAGRIDPRRAARCVSPRDFTSAGDDTVYLAVVDGEGNAVSLIQSLFEAFGSCAMVPETGMLLHNRGRGFSLDPAHPNRLEPGKRPYHTLHPAMILKEGKPLVVLGTPGADGQTQTVMQLCAALLDFGADAQQAVEAPRWRSEPDGTLRIEGRFPPETLDGLRARGHELEVLDAYDGVMGSSQAIAVDSRRGVVAGGADPRRQAYAIGR